MSRFGDTYQEIYTILKGQDFASHLASEKAVKAAATIEASRLIADAIQSISDRIPTD